jgi:N-acetylneuraminic acid mutarotase
MKTPRYVHGSVFYGGFLYVIGGVNTAYLAECERYDSSQDKWQPIAPLPHATSHQEAIVCGYTRRIYIFGGHGGSAVLDLIQEFELESQTWKLLEVKLPSKSCFIPCFRVKNQALIYFIQGGALHSFSPITYTLANVKPVTNISSYNGPSYFAKGTLYYPDNAGPLKKLVIGEIN